MRLAVVSHKLVWNSTGSPSGYATDGGFPFQIEVISELFDETKLVVPSDQRSTAVGLAPIIGRELQVVGLSVPIGRGLRRKLGMPVWLIKNGPIIWKEVRRADAVHTPIPGDVGTIGMIFALILRKPLVVRHCGNWFVQRTVAERFWKWSMEFFGGGKNVMFATGGSSEAPSQRNPNLKWIFSTSLRREQMAHSEPRTLPSDGKIRLMIACRQEERKGTDVVIASMPAIQEAFPGTSLDVVGDGSLLLSLKQQVANLGLEDSVRFHGKLEHSKVMDLFGQAHLFCYPTSASEGFPKVVLEALASGIPVITTRVSVLPQLIGNGCGVLLNAPSSAELTAAMSGVCTDKERYTVMSKRALEVARQYCLEDWRDYIGKVLCEAWQVNSLSGGPTPVS